jgi:hypothetical protein
MQGHFRRHLPLANCITAIRPQTIHLADSQNALSVTIHLIVKIASFATADRKTYSCPRSLADLAPCAAREAARHKNFVRSSRVAHAGVVLTGRFWGCAHDRPHWVSERQRTEPCRHSRAGFATASHESRRRLRRYRRRLELRFAIDWLVRVLPFSGGPEDGPEVREAGRNWADAAAGGNAAGSGQIRSRGRSCRVRHLTSGFLRPINRPRGVAVRCRRLA